MTATATQNAFQSAVLDLLDAKPDFSNPTADVTPAFQVELLGGSSDGFRTRMTAPLAANICGIGLARRGGWIIAETWERSHEKADGTIVYSLVDVELLPMARLVRKAVYGGHQCQP